MRTRERMNIGVIVVAFLACPEPGRGEWLCWSSDQGRRIECSMPDGSLRHDLVTSDGKPMGLALDATNNRLYWAERDSERVMSLSLTGTSAPTTIAQLPVGAGLRGMAIAESIGKIYWVAENLQSIQRANLDGTGVETLAITPGSFFDVQVDDQAGKLYWTDGTQIRKGNLDGTSPVAIVSNTDQPYYLALDPGAGKIYWTDFARNEIGRANLDGTGREDPGPINGLLDRPVGIILDQQNGKVYWTLEGGTLERANLDGTNPEIVHTGLESPWDITLASDIPLAGVIPAASTWSLIGLSLCVLSAGSILIGRRRSYVSVG